MFKRYRAGARSCRRDGALGRSPPEPAGGGSIRARYDALPPGQTELRPTPHHELALNLNTA
jgi:hypothetical protein